ncbi:MAG: hypothetical protein ACHQ50_05110 [Fimbriimonadales bacterium]
MLLAVAVIAVLGGSQGSPLDARVTYTNPGMGVPQLVEQLSRTTQVPLFAPKAFQTDVIAVRVKEQPLNTLLDKIGDLTAADWVLRDGRYELVRSTEKLRSEERAEFQAQVEVFQRVIDREKKQVAALEPWTNQAVRKLVQTLVRVREDAATGNDLSEAAMSEWRTKNPGARARSRIIASLDPKVLAALPLDRRIVFSDRPTRLQRPLPESAAATVKSFGEEQDIWSDVASQIAPEENGETYTRGVGKLVLAVTKMRSGGRILTGFELRAANRTGQIIAHGRGDFYGNDDYADLEAPKPQPGEQRLALSAVGKELDAVFSEPPPNRIPSEIAELLLHPEQHEPLSLVEGETMVRIAEAQGRSMVADLPDEIFLMGLLPEEEKMPQTMALKYLQSVGIKVDESGGWTIVRPRYPTSARAQRVDRSFLGARLRSCVARGYAGLDDWASLALAAPGNTRDSIALNIAGPFLSGDYGDGTMLRLYGLLDSNQRRSLANGTPLPLSTLTLRQAEAVDALIGGRNSGLEPQGKPSDGELKEIYNSIRLDPTEVFANGIPDDSSLAMTSRPEPVLLSPPSDPVQGIYCYCHDLGASDLADALFSKEKPSESQGGVVEVDLHRDIFRLGTRRSLAFTFTFGNLARMRESLTDTDPKMTRAMPYDQLPQDFRKQVQDWLEELRRDGTFEG